LGAVVLALLIAVAAAASLLATHNPTAQDGMNTLAPPGSDNWLGTDSFGRDLYSRIIFGARISLYVGFVSVLLGATVGTLVGVTSGYLGGKVDLLVQRVVDAFLGFPTLLLALIMMVALGGSINNVTLAIAIVFTPRFARLSRASALSVREEVYSLAAEAIGCRTMRIVLRHVLPNSLAPVFVLATGYLGQAIVTEAGLSFLGLGVPPPTPSWGGMLRQGADGYMEVAPGVSIFPGLALSIVVFSFAFLGDALRDILDPRLRGR
jgi:peptide/nickel transport system permease protein